MYIRRVFPLIICASLVACNSIDNLMLGQDNSPKPNALESYTQRVAIKPKWQQQLGADKAADNHSQLTPAIVDKVIFTALPEGKVVASRLSGAVLWQQSLKHPISSGPVVNQRFVVLGGDDATVTVLARDTGKQLWQASVSNAVLAAPLIDKDAVYVKTVDGQLSAYQLSSGKLKWRFSEDSPNLILKTSSGLSLSGQTIIAAFPDGKLIGLDKLTGQQRWSQTVAYPTGASDVERMVDISSTPVIKNGVAYLASFQGEVVAMTLADGQFLWRYKLSSFNDLALHNDQLFVTASNGDIFSLNRADGAVLWRQTALKNRGVSAPTYHQGHLIVTDKLGYVHVLSASDGHQLAHTQVATGFHSAVSVYDNQIIVLANNGLLLDVEVS